MPRVVVSVKEEILEAAQRRQAAGLAEDVAQFLADLINLGFEHRLRELYKQFEAGGISLGKFAAELGLGVRDLYEALEQRNLATSNIVPKPVNANG